MLNTNMFRKQKLYFIPIYVHQSKVKMREGKRWLRHGKWLEPFFFWRQKIFPNQTH